MRYLKKFSVLLAVFIFLVTAQSAIAGEATTALKSTLDEALTLLTNPELKAESKLEARRVTLREIFRNRFDYREMGKRSLGKHWKKINAAERDEFSDLFAKLIEVRYITKIEAYTDEKINYGGERAVKNKVQVNTNLITKQGTEIPINYKLLKNKAGKWVIYDVVIEGIGLVRNYRTNFGKFLSRKSFADLVADLKSKV